MKHEIAWMYFALSVCAFAASAADNKDAEFPQRLGLLVNQYRADHGLAALAVDTTIASLAQEHSAAMAKAGQMNHDDFPSRVQRSGLAMCVENVGWNYPTPEDQFAGWRASPGHNANMLDPRVERMGTGTVANYVTLIACGK